MRKPVRTRRGPLRPGVQPRDTRGRYTRRPQLPAWGWAVCLSLAVLLVVAANL